MKICFIPIDNRPVCYNLAKDIATIDEEIELFIPPREFLGNLTKNAGVNEILDWMKNLPETDAMILSLDTIAYGGLIPSRRGNETLDEIKCRLEALKPMLKGKKVYAFSSIMRISNNNCNEEEKEYWKDYGKKIFEYSYNYGELPYSSLILKSEFYASPLRGEAERSSDEVEFIPNAILQDYLMTRKRNFEINKLYLDWQKEGLFETLIFSKDDCAPKGFNVEEARELERLGGKTKTGADEIPLTLLARAIEKDIKVFVQYMEPGYKRCMSNYEDVSIEQSVLGQLELGGFKVVEAEVEADFVLVVNNFIEKQGEHVMGWETQGKYRGNFVAPDKPYAVADVRYANGADNDFVEHLLPQIDLKNFYGYSGWNTSANTLGSLLAGVKVRWQGKYNVGKYNEEAFKHLQMIRFLDDWAYQANIRVNGQTPDIGELMKPFEERLIPTLSSPLCVIPAGERKSISYSYPWNRSFEIEIEFI